MHRSTLAFLLLLSGGLIYLLDLNFIYLNTTNYSMFPVWPGMKDFCRVTMGLVPCFIAPAFALKRYLEINSPKWIDLLAPLASYVFALLPVVLFIFVVNDQPRSFADGQYRKHGISFTFIIFPVLITTAFLLGYVGNWLGNTVSHKSKTGEWF